MSFTIPMDLSGAKVRAGGANEVEPGVYEGKTTSVEVYNNGKSLKFEVDLGDAGTAELYPGLDMTKAGNQNAVLTALASHGKNVEKIKAAGKDFKLVDTMFTQPGKNTCYVLVTKVEGIDDQGRPKLNDKAFITKERYEAIKAVGGKVPARKDTPAPAGATATGAQTPAAGGAAAPAGTNPANIFD